MLGDLKEAKTRSEVNNMVRYKMKWTEQLVFCVDADSEVEAIKKSEDVIFKQEGEGDQRHEVNAVGFQLLKAKREVQNGNHRR